MINNADVLIVDECSMISAGLLETVKLCCFATKDAGKNNFCLLDYLFGDLFQLPAVENPQVFQSPLWKHFQMVSLKENCRQSEDLVYAELLNRIRIGNHSSEDLEVLSKRVCGTGHPFDQECAITENATVLCSKHEYKDVINEQLLSTLPSEVIECHASDSDCSGAPLNKFQITKLNQSKSAPPQVLKLKCGAPLYS